MVKRAKAPRKASARKQAAGRRSTAMAKTDKPNILVIWGDDIGVYNVSAYHRGLMGGRTPNIDRIANEGILFTDHYA
jgi:arylsulfatase A-like enzyme